MFAHAASASAGGVNRGSLCRLCFFSHAKIPKSHSRTTNAGPADTMADQAMQRRNVNMLIAVGASLAVHVAAVPVSRHLSADLLVGSDKPQRPAAGQTVSVSLVWEMHETEKDPPKPKPPEPPKPDPQRPDLERTADRVGEKTGDGTATHKATGKEWLNAREASQDQPLLSRDPTGPARVGVRPSPSTAIPGGAPATPVPTPPKVPQMTFAPTPAAPVVSPAPPKIEAAVPQPLPPAQVVPTIPRPLVVVRPGEPAPPVAPPMPLVAVNPTDDKPRVRSDLPGLGEGDAGTDVREIVRPNTPDPLPRPVPKPVDKPGRFDPVPVAGPRLPLPAAAPPAKPDREPASRDPLKSEALAVTLVPVHVNIPPAPTPAAPTVKIPTAPTAAPQVIAVAPSPAEAPPTPAAVAMPAPRPGRTAESPADHAQQSDSEIDAFAKIGSATFRDGKVDARFGRKVKTVRPKIPIVGQIDAFAMGNPTVTLKVNIDQAGKVTGVAVHKSSGSNEIDMPCLLAMYDWWFEPLHDKSGKAVPDTILFTLTFH